MKQAIKWVANDGTEFSVFSDCEKYEVLCEAVSEAMKNLAAKPDGCDFANGSGYIAHTQAGLDAAIAILAAAALDFYPKGGTSEEWFTQWRDGKRHVSHVARLVNDGRERCLDAAFYRLMCIDGKLREWGQPYYAAYPDQAKDVCLNQPPTKRFPTTVALALCILAAACVGCADSSIRIKGGTISGNVTNGPASVNLF
jgi:hypothetical protein